MGFFGLFACFAHKIIRMRQDAGGGSRRGSKVSDPPPPSN